MLAVDLNLPPHPHLPTTYWGAPETANALPPSRLPLDAAFVLLGKLGLVGFGEKALLVAIVFLAGYGMHRLVPARRGAARAYAGVLYALNPFVYDRIWSGQWFLLLGYALLPWGLSAFLNALNGDRGAKWRFGAIAFLCAAGSGHMFGLLGLLCVVAAIATRRFARAAVAGAVALAASLFWLLPSPGVVEFWSRVGPSELAYYRSVSDGRLGVGASLAGLGGFWNDVAPAHDFVTVWPVLAAVLVLLTVWGIVVRARDPLMWAVALAGVLGFLLALGTSASITRGTFEWLAARSPEFRSFREPQKGIALLAFAYAYLGAPAVEDLARIARRAQLRAVVAVALVLVPVVLGYREAYGLWGRMRTSTFPASWAEARPLLPRDARTLFLPWDGYVELSFAHYRSVANPAPAYFSSPILASRSIAGEVVDSQQAIAARVVAQPASTSFTRCLAHLGVGAILASDELGAAQYAALAHRRDLTLVKRWDDLALYRLDRPGGLVMEGAARSCAPVRPLAVKVVDPAHLRLAQPAPANVVLGVVQPGGWRVHGTSIVLARWSEYRRNYLAGLAALLVLVVLWTLERRSRRR